MHYHLQPGTSFSVFAFVWCLCMYAHVFFFSFFLKTQKSNRCWIKSNWSQTALLTRLITRLTAEECALPSPRLVSRSWWQQWVSVCGWGGRSQVAKGERGLFWFFPNQTKANARFCLPCQSRQSCDTSHGLFPQSQSAKTHHVLHEGGVPFKFLFCS